jgi:hypothetical protein
MGVLSAARVRPGDRIQHRNENDRDEGIVLGVEHDLLNKMSNIQISSVPTSLEDILQKFQEDSINQNERATARTEQKETLSISTGASVEISHYWNVSTKYISPSGIIIGDSRRGLIHGDADTPDAATNTNHVIGMSKGKRMVKRRG